MINRVHEARAVDAGRPAPRGERQGADGHELLDAVADGVLVLGQDARGLVVDWASRRFLALAGLPALPAGSRPDFLYSYPANRPLTEHPRGASLPGRMRLAIRPAQLPVCLVDAACRPLADGRVVLSFCRVPDDEPFALFADLPLPTLVFDATMRLRWLNAAASLVIGMDAGELLGRDWYEFLPEARDRRLLHENCLAGPALVHTAEAVPLTFPGQRQRWFRVHYRPYRDASGAVAGLIALGEDVTERHVAELALHRTRESLRLAAEGAHVGFFEYDVAEDAFEASDEYYAMLGLDAAAERAKANGDKWARAHPDDVGALRAELAALLADPERRSEVELRLAAGTGRWLWMLQRARVTEVGPDGRARRIAGMVIDIDRRKRAERGLAQSEARYRTLAAITPGLLHESEYDAAGRLVLRWASEGLTRLLGWTVEEFNARGGWSTALHPADRAAAEARVARIYAGEPTRAEVRLLTKGGGYVWMSSYSCPLQEPDTGRIAVVMGALYEVGHLKETEAQLRESEERFRLAAEAFDGIIYDYDARTGAITRSRGIREVLGYAPDAVAPTIAAWQALMHPEDVARLGTVDVFAEPGRLAFDAHYRLRHAAGHWVEVWDRAVALRDADGTVVRVVGCSIDVTDQRRFQRMLAEAEAVAHAGSWEYDLRTQRPLWSPETYRIHDLEPGATPLPADPGREFCAPEFRAAVAAAAERAERTGEPWELDIEIVTARGRRRWVRVSGRAERQDGRTLRLYGAVVDIDTLKRAQLQLQQQGDWLRMAIDAASLTAWRWYPDTDETLIDYRSDSLRPRYTAGRPTLAGWLEAVDPPDRERVGAALRRTARDGTPTHEEYALRDATGSRLWLVTRATRSHDGPGYVVTGTTQDVTARRDAEERLRASETVLRSVAENSPDFVTIVAPDLRIGFVNRAIGGVRPADLVGRPAAEFALGDPGAMLRHLRHVLETGKARRYEASALRPDGLVHHYEQRLGAIRDDQTIAGVIVHTTDVTDRRDSERQLRAQASVLATMLEGIVLVDASGAIRLTNPAFDRMFGHEPGALEGRPFGALLGEGAPSPESRHSFGFLGRRADGARFEAAAIASALEFAGEPYTVYVVQDVTERRMLERELLEIANREQRRIGSDLHDGLGQELTGVALLLRGLASRVKRGQPATAADLDELVALVNGAIESTRALARGLSPIELERGGLVYALRALAVRARELYGLDVRFRSRVWPALTLDAAATTHLYRIAQEALTNIARHAEATHATVSLTARGRRVTLTIADDGRGLQRPNENGMGLKIMQYRAQMMGGELAIGPAPVRGTRVACRVAQPEPPGELAAGLTA